MSRRSPAVLVLAALSASAAIAAGGGAAARGQGPSVCLGDPTASGVQPRPAPKLRFGMNPAGEAGALGPAVPAVPDDPPRTLAALARLRPSGRPFVLRLNRFFWSDGEAGIQRFLGLTRRYASAGYDVELQLRYHPRREQEGDIPGFVRFVREVVDRFGSNRRVVGMQVTNEVNLTFSPDSSDGAYRGARDALIQGVMAAKEQARRRGFDQLTVGFNWVYRTDPSNEDSFWSYLRDRGGPAFRAAVDWVGLDAYPGTFFPPAEPPGGEADGMVNAMSQLRRCWLPKAQIPDRVPIHVEENGWPTGPGRSEERQVAAMRDMIGAVDRFRGTYNVSDYRWFDLRDHNTSSANFQHHYGLLRDDYSPKPAFGLYRQLAAQLAGGSESASTAPPAGVRGARARVGLALGHRWRRLGRRGRCATRPLRAAVVGADRRRVRSVEFYVGRLRLARAPRAPFVRTLPVHRLRRIAPRRIRAVALLRDGRRVTMRRTLRGVCAG